MWSIDMVFEAAMAQRPCINDTISLMSRKSFFEGVCVLMRDMVIVNGLGDRDTRHFATAAFNHGDVSGMDQMLERRQ